MTTARDIMHVGAECVGERETLAQAARRMRDLDVGALPVCGDDDQLHGIITDRDIVVRCVAAGGDPQTVTAGDLAQGEPFTIDPNASVGQVLQVMEEHRIRRLPVIWRGTYPGSPSPSSSGQSARAASRPARTPVQAGLRVRWLMNQSRASPAAASRVPGSSNR
jgi:predicted transcriptional regulator